MSSSGPITKLIDIASTAWLPDQLHQVARLRHRNLIHRVVKPENLLLNAALSEELARGHPSACPSSSLNLVLASRTRSTSLRDKIRMPPEKVRRPSISLNSSPLETEEDGILHREYPLVGNMRAVEFNHVLHRPLQDRKIPPTLSVEDYPGAEYPLLYNHNPNMHTPSFLPPRALADEDGDGGHERDPLEDQLLAGLKDLTQKTIVPMHWAVQVCQDGAAEWVFPSSPPRVASQIQSDFYVVHAEPPPEGTKFAKGEGEADKHTDTEAEYNTVMCVQAASANGGEEDWDEEGQGQVTPPIPAHHMVIPARYGGSTTRGPGGGLVTQVRNTPTLPHLALVYFHICIGSSAPSRNKITMLPKEVSIPLNSSPLRVPHTPLHRGSVGGPFRSTRVLGECAAAERGELCIEKY
ncbi:hypothetical protein DFH07DRAFT_968507 [Mycena maculata]|uniref:Uncharacterized protein n=1 Tax=Mycena maculata TaxID=230809 RepID=A0AAD7MU51_9AGAR|nr:hypothetical protein DFH07DRAFT_968507 [Mycena maculata]